MRAAETPVEATRKSSPFDFDDAGLTQVIADPLRFKRQLRIGEEAYALMRAKNVLVGISDTAGAAATGAGIASSTMVASTFFAPTGLAAWLGLATAATPIGWVVAAAAVAGGTYYGISRWFADKGDSFVDTIPKYINTPLDVLGAALVDLLGSLALRVAAIDGRIDPSELGCIADHFVHDWGFDPVYVTRALDVLRTRADETRVKVIARDLARFQASNPDCNGPAMQAELLKFLRELIAADGVVDEREELALEAIERTLREEAPSVITAAGERLLDASRVAASSAAGVATTIGGTAKTLGGSLGRTISGLSGVKVQSDNQ